MEHEVQEHNDHKWRMPEFYMDSVVLPQVAKMKPGEKYRLSIDVMVKETSINEHDGTMSARLCAKKVKCSKKKGFLESKGKSYEEGIADMMQGNEPY